MLFASYLSFGAFATVYRPEPITPFIALYIVISVILLFGAVFPLFKKFVAPKVNFIVALSVPSLLALLNFVIACLVLFGLPSYNTAIFSDYIVTDRVAAFAFFALALLFVIQLLYTLCDSIESVKQVKYLKLSALFVSITVIVMAIISISFEGVEFYDKVTGFVPFRQATN